MATNTDEVWTAPTDEQMAAIGVDEALRNQAHINQLRRPLTDSEAFDPEAGGGDKSDRVMELLEEDEKRMQREEDALREYWDDETGEEGEENEGNNSQHLFEEEGFEGDEGDEGEFGEPEFYGGLTLAEIKELEQRYLTEQAEAYEAHQGYMNNTWLSDQGSKEREAQEAEDVAYARQEALQSALDDLNHIDYVLDNVVFDQVEMELPGSDVEGSFANAINACIAEMRARYDIPFQGEAEVDSVVKGLLEKQIARYQMYLTNPVAAASFCRAQEAEYKQWAYMNFRTLTTATKFALKENGLKYLIKTAGKLPVSLKHGIMERRIASAFGRFADFYSNKVARMGSARLAKFIEEGSKH